VIITERLICGEAAGRRENEKAGSQVQRSILNMAQRRGVHGRYDGRGETRRRRHARRAANAVDIRYTPRRCLPPPCRRDATHHYAMSSTPPRLPTFDAARLTAGGCRAAFA